MTTDAQTPTTGRKRVPVPSGRACRRRFLPGDSFFLDCDLLASEFLRDGALGNWGTLKTCYPNDINDTNSCILTNENSTNHKPIIYECTQCEKGFTNPQLLATHININHSNVCRTCKKIFNTNKLLDIHIKEKHDMMFEVQFERAAKKICGVWGIEFNLGFSWNVADIVQQLPLQVRARNDWFDGYVCLVDGCLDTFSCDCNRKYHLVNTHCFPEWFDFHGDSFSEIDIHPKPKQKNKKKSTTSERKVCKFYNKKGGCRKGEGCPFLHDKPTTATTVNTNEVVITNEDDMEVNELEKLFTKHLKVAPPLQITFGRKKR